MGCHFECESKAFCLLRSANIFFVTFGAQPGAPNRIILSSGWQHRPPPQGRVGGVGSRNGQGEGRGGYFGESRLLGRLARSVGLFALLHRSIHANTHVGTWRIVFNRHLIIVVCPAGLGWFSCVGSYSNLFSILFLSRCFGSLGAWVCSILVLVLGLVFFLFIGMS